MQLTAEIDGQLKTIQLNRARTGDGPEELLITVWDQPEDTERSGASFGTISATDLIGSADQRYEPPAMR